MTTPKREGQIIEAATARFTQWDPAAMLSAVSEQEAKYCRGFLKGDLMSLFPDIAAHWQPMCASLGAELRVLSVTPTLAFPEHLEHIFVVSTGGELGVFGIDDRTYELFVAKVTLGAPGLGGDVLVEYLLRRFAATLHSSWSSESELQIGFLSADAVEQVEILGCVEIRGEVNGRPFAVFVGLGGKMLDTLDHALRHRSNSDRTRPGSGPSHLVTVDLVELTVSPARLIDYMRAGTVIDLEIECGSTVSVHVDGSRWAEGKLVRCGASFAVQVTELLDGGAERSAAATSVAVELARFEVSHEELQASAGQGATLMTGKPLSAQGLMVIGGEQVASVLIGCLDGKFALSVLPR